MTGEEVVQGAVPTRRQRRLYIFLERYHIFTICERLIQIIPTIAGLMTLIGFVFLFIFGTTVYIAIQSGTSLPSINPLIMCYPIGKLFEWISLSTQT